VNFDYRSCNGSAIGGFTISFARSGLKIIRRLCDSYGASVDHQDWCEQAEHRHQEILRTCFHDFSEGFRNFIETNRVAEQTA
jgi:hypothetical protein